MSENICVVPSEPTQGTRALNFALMEIGTVYHGAMIINFTCHLLHGRNKSIQLLHSHRKIGHNTSCVIA